MYWQGQDKKILKKINNKTHFHKLKNYFIHYNKNFFEGVAMMKKKIFIICMFFLCLILIILGYKFFVPGNNKNIESETQLDEYILNINNYELEGNVTVYSNKNVNTYRLKQLKNGDYQRQEIVNDNENYGLIIENEGSKITIKNTVLDLTSVFENYEEVAKNSIGLDSFIDDYRETNDSEITEEEQCYRIQVKVKDSQNKYAQNKCLWINKKSRKIEKFEVSDVNNNKTIFIEYTKFEIL